MAKSTDPFRWFHSSPEVIRLVVMMYARYSPKAKPASMAGRAGDGLAPMTDPETVRQQSPRTDASIDRALDFLQARQLPHGEFTTLLGRDRTMTQAAPDSACFVTTHVLHALTFVEDPRAARMIRGASDFLLSQREAGGLWRYWSSRDHKHARLGPDLDDTACASDALRRTGLGAPANHWAFKRMRDSEGRYFTWVLPERLGAWDLRGRLTLWLVRRKARSRAARVRTPPDEDPRFVVMRIDRDDVDPVVNANVLLYLGQGPETEAARRFVSQTVLADVADFSLYYGDPLMLHYAVARASGAAPGLRALGPHIVSRIESRLASGEVLDPLKTSLAVTALSVFAPAARALRTLVDALLSSQSPDGGWPAAAFYNVFGSEELTTSLCLEALARTGRNQPS